MVFAEDLNARLLAALDRPDLRVVADRRRIVYDASLETAFRADPGGEVVLGAACLGPGRICAFHIRHAVELSMLLDAAAQAACDAGGARAEGLRVLAGLYAARTAARFWMLDASPADEPIAPDPVPWLRPMAESRMPTPEALRMVWDHLRDLQGPSPREAGNRLDDRLVSERVIRTLAACWDLLGPAETLMAQGGDARLAVDPCTGLNHYGCSHRPRPWAITFASSTASSLSERGFGGAEAARRRLAAAALGGRAQEALEYETERVRAAIAAHYGLPDGCAIVLAASGTDSEMIALALCGLADAGGAVRPVSSILLAPEETGAGVPLAAAGRHFAGDTALGYRVAKGERIDGFPDDTRVLSVPIRDAAGRLLPPDAVDEACIRIAGAEAAQGRTVLLHRLDLSKTGLLAPGMACLDMLQRQLGDRLELVIDACQTRLDRRRVQDYVARGCMVMITGSKFFTGPPFCGALLLPERLARRLSGPGRLPAGLAAYGGRADWPADASAVLPDAAPAEATVNLGLVLRWQAAIAEMQAFAEVPDRLALERAAAFIDGVEAVIAASPDVAAVVVPQPAREALRGDAGETMRSWDQLQTIRSFLVLEPAAAGSDRAPLDMARARLVYRWLNADVTRALPATADAKDRALARLLCHIGQPAPVADDRLDDAMAGALRISVGARLLSGEPSHAGLGSSARLAREIDDVRRIVEKIELLLRCWEALVRLDPEPRFASDAVPQEGRALPGPAKDRGLWKPIR